MSYYSIIIHWLHLLISNASVTVIHRIAIGIFTYASLKSLKNLLKYIATHHLSHFLSVCKVYSACNEAVLMLLLLETPCPQERDRSARRPVGRLSRRYTDCSNLPTLLQKKSKHLEEC